MKSVFVFALCLSVSALAHARDYDGCYQLFNLGVMAPAVCVSGSSEEGIGGAGARLSVFRTYTTKLIACMRSTSLSMDDDRFEFIVDGTKEMVLSNFSPDGRSGHALIGNSKLQFLRLNVRESLDLLDSAYRGDCL